METGRYSVEEAEYFHRVAVDHYRFDQCRALIDTEQLLDGSLFVRRENISERRLISNLKTLVWQNFNWSQGDDQQLAITATIRIRQFDSFAVNANREVTIERYSLIRDNQVIEIIENGALSVSEDLEVSEAIQDYALNASGRVTTRAGIPVQVTIDPPMFRRLAVGAVVDQAIPFSGQINFDAYDGSQLTLVAAESGNTPGLQVDLSYHTVYGMSTMLSAQTFVGPTVVAPN